MRVDTAFIDNHPLNRAASGYNEEVIESIKGTLKERGDFEEWSLPVVRMLNDNMYQIVIGHHRVEAARRLGLKQVTVNVRKMTDLEAMVALVMSNEQTAGDPLDIGVVALEAVTLGKGGRGKSGGLSEFARMVGRDQSGMSRLMQAARVLKTYASTHGFTGKSTHLYTVGLAPDSAWSVLLERVTSDDLPTVKDVESAVSEIKEALESVPQRWRDIGFITDDLLAPRVARKNRDQDKVSRKAIVNVMSAASTILDLAADIDSSTGESVTDEMTAWLVGNAGADSWDVRRLSAMITDLNARLAAIKETKATATLSEAVMWLKTLDEKSADLLLTDPPYATDVGDISEFAARWVPVALSRVKDTGRAYICTGTYPDELEAYLAAFKETGWTVGIPIVWHYKNTLGPSPVMDYKTAHQIIWHLYKDGSGPIRTDVLNEKSSVQEIAAPGTAKDKRLHAWQKPDELARMLVMHGSDRGGLVIDPFCGTGAFIAAAADLGRSAHGCDLNADMLRICRDERGIVIE